MLPVVDDQTFIIGTYHSVLLPKASGGVQPYAYEFTCPGGLPAGLHFSKRTRVLSGTPTAAYRGSCSYSVTDSNDPMAVESHSVDLHVHGVGLALPVVDDQTFVIGTYRSVLFPQASGGVQPYAYEFTCPGGLPAGLHFSKRTRVLSGTPTAAYRGSCSYSVTDSNDPMAAESRSVDLHVRGVDLGPLRLRPPVDQSVSDALENAKDAFAAVVELYEDMAGIVGEVA